MEVRCEHNGTTHSVVKESNCTVEVLDIICDQCGQVVKTEIQT